MKQLLAGFIATQVLFYLAIGLDLPVFRQVFVFIYLTVAPGFALLKFLKLERTRIVDKICFSIGLSLVFLMFVGFLVNFAFLTLGISRPLSAVPLGVVIGLLTLCFFFAGYRRELFRDFGFQKFSITYSSGDILKLAILSLPIPLGIMGALFVSFEFLSVPLLSLMIIIIAILIGVSLKFIPSKFYPFLIFSFSIALALHVLLISKYVMGVDAQLEFQISNLTISRGYWAPLGFGTSDVSPLLLKAALNFNSMLSVTVLPTIYSVLLKLSPEILYKTLYAFIFSLVPLVLYRVYEEQMGRSSSILAALFLISSPLTFYGVEFLSLNRQIVAVFFLVLSILVLSSKQLESRKGSILLFVFGAGLIVSHYSVGYLYLGFVFSAYILLRLSGKSSGLLNGKIVLLLSALGFVWYAFTESPLTTLGDVFYNVYSRFFQDILSTSARSPYVFAPHSILTFASAFNWALFFAVHFMILVGILVVFFKPKKAGLNPTFRVFLILSSVVLFVSLAVPNVAPALNFSRFYQLSILFIAPCFVLGGQALAEFLERIVGKFSRRNSPKMARRFGAVLVCTILTGYFVSQSGFVNFATQASPLSLSLDYSRFTTTASPESKASFYSGYIPEQNRFSAGWLSTHINPKSTVYADVDSDLTVLLGYGPLLMDSVPLKNATIPIRNSFIYLSKLNIRDLVVVDPESEGGFFNITRIAAFPDQSNVIYSNGNGEVRQVT